MYVISSMGTGCVRLCVSAPCPCADGN